MSKRFIVCILDIGKSDKDEVQYLQDNGFLDDELNSVLDDALDDMLTLVSLEKTTNTCIPVVLDGSDSMFDDELDAMLDDSLLDFACVVADDKKVCLSYDGQYDEQKVEARIVDDMMLSAQGKEWEFVMLNGSEVLNNNVVHGSKCGDMCEHSSDGKDAWIPLMTQVMG